MYPLWWNNPVLQNRHSLCSPYKWRDSHRKRSHNNRNRYKMERTHKWYRQHNHHSSNSSSSHMLNTVNSK